MKTRDFSYHLPKELIAQHPAINRTDSRLLCLDKEKATLSDRPFMDLPGLLGADDILVFNDTRVIPARLYGHKPSGGKVEVLIERLTGEHSALAQVRASKTPKAGTEIIIDSDKDPVRLRVMARKDGLFVISSDDKARIADVLEQAGHMPLPPYIQRTDEELDFSRYQTVYADQPGAVAAPTAGLHFDEAMLQRIDDLGVQRANVTLHVGAGTFQPVRTEDIEDHSMHSEYIVVPQDTVDLCTQARQRGGRIIAVGTTAVRSLETASSSGELQAYRGETDIFIYPGYRFNSVDALLTNFHLPESTLLMLVCAFAGIEPTMQAYRHAVEQGYRFFSYGDAMLIS